MPASKRKTSKPKKTEDLLPKQKPAAVREPAAQFVVSRTRRIVSKVPTTEASGTNRKNLHINQMLLNKAKAKLGAKTETETVALSLAAVVELAEFRQAMLAGFDEMMKVGGLNFDAHEELDFSGFGITTPIR